MFSRGGEGCQAGAPGCAPSMKCIGDYVLSAQSASECLGVGDTRSRICVNLFDQGRLSIRYPWCLRTAYVKRGPFMALEGAQVELRSVMFLGSNFDHLS